MQITILETSVDGVMGEIPCMNRQGVAVIMPATDLAQAVDSARRMKLMAQVPFEMVVVYDSIRQGFVKTLNQAVAIVQPEFAAYVAQDALAGKGWLRIAQQKLVQEAKGLCAFNDGVFGGGLAQFGLVRTAFAETHYGTGCLFHPGYRTHRADEDLTHLAYTLDQYAYAPDALLMEIEHRMRRLVDPQDKALWAERKLQIWAAVGKEPPPGP